MNGKKAKAARRAQREAASMVVSVLHRATNETTESFGKRMYRAVVAQAVADGEPLSQRCVDVAETRARCWFADEPDLALGHNPPRDQRVIKFLIDTLADPIWDRLPKDATADDYFDVKDAETTGCG
jgi:hypothetical protein